MGSYKLAFFKFSIDAWVTVESRMWRLYSFLSIRFHFFFSITVKNYRLLLLRDFGDYFLEIHWKFKNSMEYNSQLGKRERREKGRVESRFRFIKPN